MNSLAKNFCIGLLAPTGTEPDFRSDGKMKLHVSVTIVIDVRLQHKSIGYSHCLWQTI